MNFDGHEMLDVAELSSTESELWAELRSAEERGNERQHLHKTAAGVEMRERVNYFLQHELEGNGYSLEIRTCIPVENNRPSLHIPPISKTSFPSFIVTLSALLERIFSLLMSPKRSKGIITY